MHQHPLHEDPDFDRELLDALALVIRRHLPAATAGGQIARFALAFAWTDVSDAGGDYVVYNGTQEQALVDLEVAYDQLDGERPSAADDPTV